MCVGHCLSYLVLSSVMVSFFGPSTPSVPFYSKVMQRQPRSSVHRRPPEAKDAGTARDRRQSRWRKENQKTTVSVPLLFIDFSLAKHWLFRLGGPCSIHEPTFKFEVCLWPINKCPCPLQHTVQDLSLSYSSFSSRQVSYVDTQLALQDVARR